MAQCVVRQVAQMLAPDCIPLFLSDGFKVYLPALLAHFGFWLQPERCQGKGPRPKPRWMPLPELLYALYAVCSRSCLGRRWPGVQGAVASTNAKPCSTVSSTRS